LKKETRVRSVFEDPESVNCVAGGCDMTYFVHIVYQLEQWTF